jgi:hypothetical protein
MRRLYPPRGYYVCECNDFRCTEPIDITGEEYDALPAGTFIVADGCETRPDAPVVETRKGYKVMAGPKYSVGGAKS